MSDSDEPGPSAALWKKSSAKTIVSFADDERTPLLSLSSATLHASTNAISRDKGKQVEVQIEDLATAAGKNIGKLLSRGEKLKDIHDKSENLENVGGLFRTHATKLTNTSWSSSIRVCLDYSGEGLEVCICWTGTFHGDDYVWRHLELCCPSD